jgi:hypothetical protein
VILPHESDDAVEMAAERAALTAALERGFVRQIGAVTFLNSAQWIDRVGLL